MRGFNAFVFILIVVELKVIIDVKLNLFCLLQYLIHELHSLHNRNRPYCVPRKNQAAMPVRMTSR